REVAQGKQNAPRARQEDRARQPGRQRALPDEDYQNEGDPGGTAARPRRETAAAEAHDARRPVRHRSSRDRLPPLRRAASATAIARAAPARPAPPAPGARAGEWRRAARI